MNNTWIYFFIALGTALIFGPIIIPQLKKLKFGQAIREEGPESHLSKSGTPTMGGLLFLVAFLTPLLVFLDIENYTAIFIVVATLGFGGIGFIDDYLKVVKKHNLGLRAKQKILMQLFMGILISVMAAYFGQTTWVPFMKAPLDLGIWFYHFIVFMAVGFNNAVNLTDGLDGLAASVTLVVALFFAYASYMEGNTLLIGVNLSMAGALLGYLRVNWYPARVFMGDTGSLALGGYVASMAIALEMPLVLVIVGLIYVLETLSVMIQVVVFKKTGKRVFKMAPIHHHFELIGWHETRIVALFVAITVLGAVFAVILLR